MIILHHSYQLHSALSEIVSLVWNYYLLSSFKITEKLHTFSFDCKLLVHENAHLKRKREDVLLTQTLLSFERKL